MGLIYNPVILQEMQLWTPIGERTSGRGVYFSSYTSNSPVARALRLVNWLSGLLDLCNSGYGDIVLTISFRASFLPDYFFLFFFYLVIYFFPSFFLFPCFFTLGVLDF